MTSKYTIVLTPYLEEDKLKHINIDVYKGSEGVSGWIAAQAADNWKDALKTSAQRVLTEVIKDEFDNAFEHTVK